MSTPPTGGRRGRKAEPRHLRLLKGNTQKRPMNEQEPIPAPVFPTCPGWMPAAGKREWARVRRLMRAHPGWVTEVDRTALIRHCVALAMLEDSASFVFAQGLVYKISGKGGIQYLAQAPQVSIMSRALALLGAADAELGFGPSSRTRVKVQEEGGDDEAAFFGARAREPRSG